jgi:phage FluMu gp28-like protein
VARAYKGGGFDDWFLPSKNELNQMYLKKEDINTTAAANKGFDFSDNLYWSSTEKDNGKLWVQNFPSGHQHGYHWMLTYSVRAVRAF